VTDAPASVTRRRFAPLRPRRSTARPPGLVDDAVGLGLLRRHEVVAHEVLAGPPGEAPGGASEGRVGRREGGVPQGAPRHAVPAGRASFTTIEQPNGLASSEPAHTGRSGRQPRGAGGPRLPDGVLRLAGHLRIHLDDVPRPRGARCGGGREGPTQATCCRFSPPLESQVFRQHVTILLWPQGGQAQNMPTDSMLMVLLPLYYSDICLFRVTMHTRLCCVGHDGHDLEKLRLSCQDHGPSMLRPHDGWLLPASHLYC